jgi:alpha-1,3-fucosyltransferase
MTYRQDADIRKQYGVIQKIKEHPTIATELNHYINSFGIDHRHISENKTKKIAWFVSNCYSKSGREKYVKELQEYIEVISPNSLSFFLE